MKRKQPADKMQQAVLEWFDQFGRKMLPWQHPITPYRVWVSEIMLQQTQVKTVIGYFNRFMDQLPDIQALANASEDTVLHLWTGLGYYARARNLHKSAQVICSEYGGKLPGTLDELTSLPGIGRSTAGAILSIAMQTPAPILDGNVKRVLSRLHAVQGWPGKAAVAQELWSLAEHYTPDQATHVANYTQAMMDIGATLCTRTNPQCQQCPLSTQCSAFKMGAPQHFPHSKPRKTKPIRQATFLILQNYKGEILLEKRPSIGLWGGLWSFPELSNISTSLADIKRWCYQHYGVSPVKIETRQTFRHSFTHFHLDITPLHAQISPSIRYDRHIMERKNHLWYHPDQNQLLGLATPIKYLLSTVLVTTQHTQTNRF